jgi:hypothetical protein
VIAAAPPAVAVYLTGLLLDGLRSRIRLSESLGRGAGNEGRGRVRRVVRGVLNSVNKLGATALHVAAYRGNDDLCRRLVVDGASVNARNKHSQTPADLAATCGHDGTARWLQRGGGGGGGGGAGWVGGGST